jgi:hypothetical protein
MSIIKSIHQKTNEYYKIVFFYKKKKKTLKYYIFISNYCAHIRNSCGNNGLIYSPIKMPNNGYMQYIHVIIIARH